MSAARRCALLLALLWLAPPLPPGGGLAHADDPAAAAARHNRRGKILFGRGRFSKALKAFEAAYAAHPDPRFLFNTARTHERLGHTDQAVNTWIRCVDAAADDAQRAEAMAGLRATCAQAGRALLDIDWLPPDATVTVDGEAIDPPGLRCLPGGDVSVEARADDHETARRRVTLAAGEVHALPLRLVRAGEAAPPAASVPETGPTAPVAPSQTADSPPWGWILLGGAAAAAITGGALYGVAFDRFATADELDPTAPGYDRRFDDLTAEGEALQIGAIVAFAGAAAAGVGAWLLWDAGDSKDTSASRMVVAPLVGPREAGVRWSVRF